MRAALPAFIVLSLAFAGCSDDAAEPPAEPVASMDALHDAVVVAVIDTGINPYHFDFLASHMPQARTPEATDDLPLTQDPATWLPGFPDPSTFASYGALNLTLTPDDEDARPADLHEADAEAWDTVEASTPDAIHYRWVPGTKLIGAITFNGGDGFAAGSHGVGSASVAVGNLHGACPECLLVFLDGGEAANRWAEEQDWIDVQTNSWGISTLGVVRDRAYAGSDTQSQRAAIERGQSIFFSAGNGVNNDFSVPNPTLFSSQEGPDWIVTVGAVSRSEQSPYSGAGKPADIANIGSAYPSAYGSETVNGTGGFGGTSNATPVTAGEYARALWLLRREAEGPSRVQKDGVIVASGCSLDVACEAAGPGAITVDQLRAALFASASFTDGLVVGTPAGTVPSPASQPKETALMAVGHGVLTGRLFGAAQLHAETQLIADLASGKVAAPEVDPESADWFVADSYCRQAIWGGWEHGAFTTGTTLPADDPEWPVRTWYVQGCPAAGPAIREGIATANPVVTGAINTVFGLLP